MASRRIHLDVVGGIAGDMFAGAMLDLYPDLERLCLSAIKKLLPADTVRVELESFSDGILHGKRFDVQLVNTQTAQNQKMKETSYLDKGNHLNSSHGHSHEHDNHHRDWKSIRNTISNSALETSVKEIAIGIFAELAEAEAWCHSVNVEDVTFHEVGAWDSIADILTAAVIINALEDVDWTMGLLPRGNGSVETAHGRLPVPAPAVVRLLHGCAFFDDAVVGERITPTGAAILKYLQPSQHETGPSGILNACGMGFGVHRFPGMSNMLRALAYSEINRFADYGSQEKIVTIRFDIDDQTPEDLAIGLGNIRDTFGVMDVVQSAVYGKKGRLATSIQVLVEPASLQSVIESCFVETTTLGLRWSEENRVVLKREAHTNRSGRQVKFAKRPQGKTTKVEIDDLKNIEGGHHKREDVRRREENATDSGSQNNE